MSENYCVKIFEPFPTFDGKRRTSSKCGQNTSQSCTMMTEAYHLSSLIMKAPKFLRMKFKRPSKSCKKARPLTALGKFGFKEITKLLNIPHKSNATSVEEKN